MIQSTCFHFWVNCELKNGNVILTCSAFDEVLDDVVTIIILIRSVRENYLIIILCSLESESGKLRTLRSPIILHDPDHDFFVLWYQTHVFKRNIAIDMMVTMHYRHVVPSERLSCR